MVTDHRLPGGQNKLSRLILQLLTGNLLYLASQFLMLVILARWTAVAEVGTYAWALAVMAPIFILANLRLQQIQATHAPHKYAFSDFLAQRLYTVLACMVLILMALWCMDDFLSAKGQLVVAVAAFRAVDSLIEVCIGQLLRYEAMSQVSRIQTVRAVGGLVCFAVGVWISKGATLAVWLQTASSAVVLVSALRRASLVSGGLGARPTVRALRNLTMHAIPLGVAFFVGAVTVNVPRYLIEARLGSSELGIFAAAAYLVVISNTLIDTALAATLPRTSSHAYRGNRKAYASVTVKLLGGTLAVGIVAVVCAQLMGHWLLRVIYGGEYENAGAVLVVLAVAALLQYGASTLRNACIATGHVIAPLPISLVNAAVTLALCHHLLDADGLIGVARGYAAGQAVAAICYVGLFLCTMSPSRWRDLEVDTSGCVSPGPSQAVLRVRAKEGDQE